MFRALFLRKGDENTNINKESNLIPGI